MKTKQYPTNSRICPWLITQEGTTLSIRRWVYLPNGKKAFERYPAIQYADIRDNKKELNNFVIRLNGFDPRVEKLKKKVTFKHAFVSDEVLYDYEQNYLASHIPNKKDRGTLFSYLKNYALGFFVNNLQLANPAQ